MGLLEGGVLGLPEWRGARAVQPGQGRGRHQAMLAQTRHNLYLEKQLECFRLSDSRHQDADPTPPEPLRLAVVRSSPGGPEGGGRLA